jgi:hypothetical protein
MIDDPRLKALKMLLFIITILIIIGALFFGKMAISTIFGGT